MINVHMSKKAILLVIDGFGVGEMENVVKIRPQDKGSNTFKNIYLNQKTMHIPNLKAIGAIDYFIFDKFSACSFRKFFISLGKSKLAHFGADSYIGHQELSGTKPKKPKRQFVREVKDKIIMDLDKREITAKWNGKMILIEDLLAIADNIETDYGLNVNVVGSIEYFDFSFIEKVGLIVRSVVKTGRVITMGGTGITKESLLDSFEVKKRDGYTAWGINIPKLKIYNQHYHVIHMGYGADPSSQISQILIDNNISVSLIGKTADVIIAKGAKYIPQVDTENVLKKIVEEVKFPDDKFIFANIQQTDLSGHEQRMDKYVKYLEIIDSYIPKILSILDKNDLFVITADHGNDPTIGHTNHTREKTPIIMFSQKFKSENLGERKTLADTGATIASFFKVRLPQSGSSFID